MEQLLKITTIPLEYQLKIQNARLEYSNSTASRIFDQESSGKTESRHL